MADSGRTTLEEEHGRPTDAQALSGGMRDPSPYTGVLDLFQTVVADRPTAVAVDASVGGSLTYAELHQRAGAVAEALTAHGLRRGQSVGVAMAPSADMVVAVLGCLAAGARYVPIDPNQSAPRTDMVLRDADVRLVLSERDAAALPPGVTRIDPLTCTGIRPWTWSRPRSNEDAYVIYTSGSTGGPKGIAVTHGNLSYSTWARAQTYPPSAVFMLVSPLAFDSSVAGFWDSLTRGGCLVVPTAEEVLNPVRLLEILASKNVTTTLLVPVLYDLVLGVLERSKAAPPGLDAVVLAGEALTLSLIERHFAALPGTALFNEYGPSEATVWASVKRYSDPGPASIGRPIPGTDLLVVAPTGGLADEGAIGELYVDGPGVTRGYLNRPEETVRAFVELPALSPRRLYRTGDLVRRLEGGELEFVGRSDDQVKIRGQRVEPQEAADVLTSIASVREAFVLPDHSRTHLVAHLSLREGTDVDAVRQSAKVLLAQGLLPTRFLTYPALPRTTNGKVDREALLERQHDALMESRQMGRVEESNNTKSTESAVTRAWSAVLDVAPPSNVNFFDLGGQSLEMFGLQQALQKETGYRPSIVELFEHTTVQMQVGLIVARLAEQSSTPSASVSTAAGGGGESLTTVQPSSSLRCEIPRPEAECVLVCLPHAGGSPTFFRGWSANLPGVEVQVACYPGRADRLPEEPSIDLVALARDIAVDVQGLGKRPVALFGHSLGAVIALEVALRLTQVGSGPLHLFASGSRDGTATRLTPRARPRPEDVERDLIRMGGTDPELLADPDFRDLVMPYLLADSEMYHGYANSPSGQLACPVSTIVGTSDSDADMRPWAALTTGGVREHDVAGGHFYLIEQPPWTLIETTLSISPSDLRPAASKGPDVETPADATVAGS